MTSGGRVRPYASEGDCLRAHVCLCVCVVYMCVGCHTGAMPLTPHYHSCCSFESFAVRLQHHCFPCVRPPRRRDVAAADSCLELTCFSITTTTGYASATSRFPSVLMPLRGTGHTPLCFFCCVSPYYCVLCFVVLSKTCRLFLGKNFGFHKFLWRSRHTWVMIEVGAHRNSVNVCQ